MDSTHRVKEDFIRFGNSFLTLLAERMFPSTLQHPNAFENIPSVFEAADATSNNSVLCNSSEAKQQENFQTCNDNSNSETDSCKADFEEKVANTCHTSMTWPDGDCNFEISQAKLSNRSGKQSCNFGWAFCCSNSKFIKKWELPGDIYIAWEFSNVTTVHLLPVPLFPRTKLGMLFHLLPNTHALCIHLTCYSFYHVLGT